MDEKYGRLIDVFVAHAYDAMYVATLAINFAGSTDPKMINAVLPKAFEIYRGVSNPDMSVDADGIQNTQIFQSYAFRNGKVEVYDVK